MPKNRTDFIIGEISKNENRPLVILMTSTHPMTDKNLCTIGSEIYNLNLPQFPIKWQNEPGQTVPSNMKIISSLDELPYRPDVILSQNIVDQYNVWMNLAFQFDCPVISFEHTLPTKEWLDNGIPERLAIDLKAAKTKRVFITEFSKNEWKEPNGHVVYHMVDQTKYCGGWDKAKTTGKAMLLVNQFTGREWAVGNVLELLQIDGGKRLELFGHNPGFNSKPLSESEVINNLRTHDVFVNTSVRSPLPASVLEAASIGIPIVSRKTCAIPEFFVDGESILFYEKPEEALALVERLIEDVELSKKLSNGAKDVISKHFNKDRYKKDWEQIIYSSIQEYHGV